MPRALIADDERLLREQLRARLTEVWPELEIVAEAKNGLEAVALTEQHHPDIVFLDIRMPGLTGVDAARQIAQLPTYEDADGWPGCEIVFITAYDQYAVQAFEQGVVDYVLKPAERERLLLTVQRIRQRMTERASHASDESTDTPLLATHTPDMQRLLQRLSSQLNPQAPAKLQWIQATVRQSIQMIAVEDVLFFISDEKYTRVQTAQVEALIDELRERYSVVIVTHSMQQAARVSQKTAFFHLGHLVEYGETAQIFTNPRDPRTESYITGRIG